jgi:flavin reductase (DIM6/NTAB) family NADH-FMN oxidoreductase RutF
MLLHPDSLSERDRYKLLIGTIVPRPIAWVSTISPDGVANLAPFSYFTIACTDPMTLLFCPQRKSDGTKKDTLVNIEATGEFVINLTNEATAEAMNRSATGLPYGDSEFAWAGVTAIPGEMVNAPRVVEAPVAFECVIRELLDVGGGDGGGTVVLGTVQCIHIRDDMMADGYVQLDILKPIGRLAGSAYTRVTDTFTIKRVPPPPEKPT